MNPSVVGAAPGRPLYALSGRRSAAVQQAPDGSTSLVLREGAYVTRTAALPNGLPLHVVMSGSSTTVSVRSSTVIRHADPRRSPQRRICTITDRSLSPGSPRTVRGRRTSALTDASKILDASQAVVLDQPTHRGEGLPRG